MPVAPASPELWSSPFAEAITPHASTNFTNGRCRAIYCGVGGNIVAVINGAPITFKNVPSGAVLPVQATRVNAVNTTATDMVALY